MCYVVYVTIGQKITFKPEYIAYMANKQKQKRLTIHLFYACLRISGMIFFKILQELFFCFVSFLSIF